MSEHTSEPVVSLFTVAIPTCNGQPHITAALEGVLAQSAEQPFQLIISDDRSDDSTLDEVRALTATIATKAAIHQNPTRLGLAGNWNQCLELTQTPFVTIFHQDDVMLPGHLQAHADAFARDAKIGMVASASTVIDAHSLPLPPHVVSPGCLGLVDRVFAPGELPPLMTAGNPLRCSAISLRLAACHDVGPFDSSYRYVLDWDYWLRLARRWHVAWLANPTVRVRWHGKSETHRFKNGIADLDESRRIMEELFSRDLATHPDRMTLREQAKDNLARAYMNRCNEAIKAGQPRLASTAFTRAKSLSPRVLTKRIPATAAVIIKSLFARS